MIDGATNPGIAPNVFAIPCTIPAYLKKKKKRTKLLTFTLPDAETDTETETDTDTDKLTSESVLVCFCAV